MNRIGTFLGLGLGLAPATTFASEPHLPLVELSWARSAEADGCISAADLKRAVRERLGRDPFVDVPPVHPLPDQQLPGQQLPGPQPPVQQLIEGTVSRRANRWHADIVVRDPAVGRVGQRRLESATADCRELDQAVVLTVTLIIDPNAKTSAESAKVAAATTDQPTAAVPVAASTASNQVPTAPSGVTPSVTPSAPSVPRGIAGAPPKGDDPRPPARVANTSRMPGAASRVSIAHEDKPVASRLLFAPALFNRILPGPTWAGALRAELPVTPDLLTEVSVAFFPELRVDYSQYEVGYGLTALGTGLCYQPNRPITPIACASGWAGVAHAIVYKGEPYQPGDRIWAGMRADAGIAANVDRLVVELRAAAMVPLTRWNFRVLNGKTLFQQPWLAPGVELGVGIRLP